MLLKLRNVLPWLVLISALVGTPLFGAKDTVLNGKDVALISNTFLRNHYSQENFDDSHSANMLEHVLNQYDPDHIYFLQSDIQEFQRNSRLLNKQLPNGNVRLAFQIHQRFMRRSRERGEAISTLLGSSLDLSTNEKVPTDRSKEPYPASADEALGILRKKLKLELLQQTVSGIKLEEATENLARRYRNVRLRFEQYNRNDILTAYLNAFAKSFDPHSAYMSQDDLENFNISLRLSLEGIGATLRWEDGYTIISTIIPGGAAYREATLKPEDKIVAVAQGDKSFEDVRNMRLGDVVKLIRGQRGTTVRLAFMRKTEGLVEKRFVARIVRDKIELKEGEATSSIHKIERAAGKEPYQLGVIKLPSFYVDFAGRNSRSNDYKSASRDVRKLLQKFIRQSVAGVLLDLRNNGGGGLDEAVSLTGLFLGRGTIVMVKNTRGRITFLTNPRRKPLYTGPLVVLTNRYSASASEIVAGALKDYGRAIIVGDRSTFGKGTVQNVIGLPRSLGALKTTVAKFYRPGSSSTQNLGVQSHIVLPSLNNHADIGESSLANAMPWDAVQPARFSRWADLSAIVPALDARTVQRRKTNPDFQKIVSNVRNYVRNRKGRKEIRLQEIVEDSRNSNSDPTAPGKSPDRKPADDDPTDVYLNEALEILADFIEIKNRQSSGARVVVQ